MKANWQWLAGNESDFNWRFVVRIAKRVVYLFVAFNLLYYLIRPLEIGHPTLYNGLFPGRLRLEWSPDEYETLAINELKLSRLLADHVISHPKGQDEYRIVVLGSSETWGFFNRPQDTMPVALDRLGLPAPGERLARSYNLAYVCQNAIKDMLILDYVLSHTDYDPDLIIWIMTPWTVDPWSDPHWLELSNPELTTQMAQQYGLSGAPLDQVEEQLNVPWWRRHSFLGERDDIAYWLINQFYGFAWAATGVDVKFPDKAVREQVPEVAKEEWAIHQPGALEALVAMTQDYGVPLMLVSTPMSWESPEYSRWLTGRAETLKVPLLDCSRLLPDSYFTNSFLHLTAEGNRLYAEQVATWLKAWWSTPAPEMDRVTMCPTLN